MKTLFDRQTVDGAAAFDELSTRNRDTVKTRFFWRHWCARDDWWYGSDATLEEALTYMLELVRETENTIKITRHMETYERESSTRQTN